MNIENPAKRQFETVLSTVAHHSMTTPDSLRLRDELRTEVADYVADMKKRGIAVAFFPVGSMAVGMATKNSNHDAQGYVSSSRDLSKEVDVLGEVTSYEHVYVDQFEDIIRPQELRDAMADAYEDPRHIGESLYQQAAIFFPSLNEDRDPAEKALVDSWRRHMLAAIVTTFPARADEVWDVMRHYMHDSVIEYESGETGAVRQKRVGRVRRGLERLIQGKEDFPQSEEAHRRAMSFLQTKRRNLNYPDLPTMRAAFGV